MADQNTPLEDGNTETQVQQPNFLSMSDEEILKLGPTPPVEASAQDTVTNTDPADLDKSDDKTDPDESKVAPDEQDPSKTQQNTEDKDTKSKADPGKKAPNEQEDQTAAKSDTQDDPNAKPKDSAADQAVVDHKAEYEKLLAPFKANGREMSVRSVDEARTLMQMGANYNKKMAALKPSFKFLKMLENAGVLNEEKLSFFIDLEKKNPEAINKLVKDSGINPLDFNEDKANAYKASSYTVDDKEIDLDTVLDDLKDSPSYTKTLQVVGNNWDAESKRFAANNPGLVRLIHDHIDGGYYDIIMEEVERERTLGRLQGLSDLHAYQKVGDAINARGGFDHLVSAKQDQGQLNQKPAPKIVEPKPQAVDDKLKDKRRAASPTKAAPTNSAAPKDFNPLSMSDEEFSKQFQKQFL